MPNPNCILYDKNRLKSQLIRIRISRLSTRLSRGPGYAGFTVSQDDRWYAPRPSLVKCTLFIKLVSGTAELSVDQEDGVKLICIHVCVPIYIVIKRFQKSKVSHHYRVSIVRVDT